MTPRWMGRSPSRARSPQVGLITRLVTAQAIVAAAVGFPFSRRHLPSILITLVLVAGLCLLALAVRTGTRPSWVAATVAEMVFFMYGLSRFVFARYVGGTLFALVVTVALLHPAVARAYAVRPGRFAQSDGGEVNLSDAGEHAAG